MGGGRCAGGGLEACGWGGRAAWAGRKRDEKRVVTRALLGPQSFPCPTALPIFTKCQPFTSGCHLVPHLHPNCLSPLELRTLHVRGALTPSAEAHSCPQPLSWPTQPIPTAGSCEPDSRRPSAGCVHAKDGYRQDHHGLCLSRLHRPRWCAAEKGPYPLCHWSNASASNSVTLCVWSHQSLPTGHCLFAAGFAQQHLCSP